MSVPAIEVDALVKTYGAQRALDSLTFQVPKGSVFGFLGPNGAGKTTAIRILLGLAKADSGHAAVLGVPVTGRDGGATRVGYLPDVPVFYNWMRASEYLAFLGSFLQMEDSITAQRSALLLDMVGLHGVTTKLGGYSRGMKQRLGIAAALLNSPELLILDEPTSALDPLGRHELLNIIAALAGKATVFFSTHILADVERVCDHVAVLDRGRVIAADTTAGLRARYGDARRLRLEVGGDPHAASQALRTAPWVRSLTPQDRGWIVEVTDLAQAQLQLPALLARNGLPLYHLETVAASLEDVFVQLVRPGAPA